MNFQEQYDKGWSSANLITLSNCLWNREYACILLKYWSSSVFFIILFGQKVEKYYKKNNHDQPAASS